MDGYICQECQRPVIVLQDGTILRVCGHTGTVVAGLNATAYGVADVAMVPGSRDGVQQRSQPGR